MTVNSQPTKTVPVSIATLFVFTVLALPVLFSTAGTAQKKKAAAEVNTAAVQSARPELLRKHVYALTRPSDQSQNKPVYRNYENVDELNRVSGYIKHELEGYGFRCRFQNFTVENQGYRNVVCTMPSEKQGTARQRMTAVVGAHYDVAGEQPGADDNASGVAGLLELGRLSARAIERLNYNLELVAYTLEEPPFFHSRNMGSAVHARSIAPNKEHYAFMVSLEMIGYFTAQAVQEYPPLLSAFYPDRGNFIAAVSNVNSRKWTEKYRDSMARRGRLDCQRLTAPSFVTGVDFSDHLNYWAIGMEAFMLTDTAFYRNRAYHTDADTADRLNYRKMGYVIDGLFEVLVTGY